MAPSEKGLTMDLRMMPPPKQCKGPLKEGPISVNHSTSPSPQPQPPIKKGKGKAKSKPNYSSKVIISTSDEESDALALCRPAPKAKAPLVSTDSTKVKTFLRINTVISA